MFIFIYHAFPIHISKYWSFAAIQVNKNLVIPWRLVYIYHYMHFCGFQSTFSDAWSEVAKEKNLCMPNYSQEEGGKGENGGGELVKGVGGQEIKLSGKQA